MAINFQASIEEIEVSIPTAPDSYRCVNPSTTLSDTASFHFFKENLPAGTYDIEIQFDIIGPIGGAILEFGHRAITVFAIPNT